MENELVKLFITGGTGYIGKNLIKHLCKHKHSCTAYVRKSSDISPIINTGCKFFYEDNINVLIKHFNKKKYDGVIHLAALYLYDHKPDDIPKLIESNILLGTNVLEAAVQSGVKWFINTGTFMQHYKNKPYSPVNLYAATKQAFEDIAKYYMETSSIRFKTLKLNDTYGPNDPRPKIFNLLKKAADTEKDLNMSPGQQIMDLVYIDDVINAFDILIKWLITKPERLSYDCYAITAGKRYTLKEMVCIYESIINKKLNINWGAKPYRQREPIIPLINFNILPKWNPKVSIEEGLKRLHE